MNKKICVSALFILFFYSSFFGQINIHFVKYLSENKLKKEHWSYLQNVTGPEDSIAYLKSKFYLQYEQDTLFLASFKKGSSLFLKDSNAVNYACLYFTTKMNLYREDWFLAFQRVDSVLANKNNLFQLYDLTNSPNVSDTLHIPQNLETDFLAYKKACSKKPLLAAIFSAIIPGLGELYIGNYRSFSTKLASHTLLGVQIGESVKKVGFFHPLSILNSGFFTAFYGANIIGSYRDAKLKMKDTKNQYLIHVSDYYSLINKYTLY